MNNSCVVLCYPNCILVEMSWGGAARICSLGREIVKGCLGAQRLSFSAFPLQFYGGQRNGKIVADLSPCCRVTSRNLRCYQWLSNGNLGLQCLLCRFNKGVRRQQVLSVKHLFRTSVSLWLRRLNHKSQISSNQAAYSSYKKTVSCTGAPFSFRLHPVGLCPKVNVLGKISSMQILNVQMHENKWQSFWSSQSSQL